MMNIELSTDYAAIRLLLTEERAYRRMVNDDAPAASDLPVELPERAMYVVATDENGMAAVFMVCPHEVNVVELHFCFAPRIWGRTETVARDFIEWLWRNTRTAIAVGVVPGYNKLALQLAKRVGFEEFRAEPGAVNKNGKAYDLIYTKIERPAA